MSNIETTLQSWKPRQPSESIRAKLFGAERHTEPAAVREQVQAFPFQWLLPATACMLLLCLIANPRTSRGRSTTNGYPMVAMILSNQSALPYLPVSLNSQQNRVADTLEWTNVSGSTSSIQSLFGPRETN